MTSPIQVAASNPTEDPEQDISDQKPTEASQEEPPDCRAHRVDRCRRRPRRQANQDRGRRSRDGLAASSQRGDPPGAGEEGAERGQRWEPAREPLPVHDQVEREAGHARSLERDLNLACRQVGPHDEGFPVQVRVPALVANTPLARPTEELAGDPLPSNFQLEGDLARLGNSR